MIKQFCQQWPYARIVAHGMFITLYAANAVTTEVNWQSKKTQRFKQAFFEIVYKINSPKKITLGLFGY